MTLGTVGKRGRDVETREAKQKKAIEAELSPAGGVKAAQDKQKAEDAKSDEPPKRKPLIGVPWQAAGRKALP